MDLARELQLAITLARRAGEAILRVRATDFTVDQKPGLGPVTEADRAAERVILAGLGAAFPDDGILAEEQGDNDRWATRPRAWLVDPLDGTKDFVAGSEGFSVMIGLLAGGRPVLGVVFQPTTGLTYAAAEGQGAHLIRPGGAREPLRPSDIADPARLRLVASASHRSPVIDEAKARLGIDDEQNIGSVGLKVGLVARGLRDLYINPDSKCRHWDTCGPEAILRLAGGRMTDLGGRPLHYGPDCLLPATGIVASNGACHDAVLARLRPLAGR